jgi:signal transduction histidine kinase
VTAEKVKTANKSKELIIATTSHELRTPLNSMMGMLKLLEDHLDGSEEGKEFHDIAFTSTKLMLSLVNDILDYSRLIAGKLTLNIELFDLEKIVDQTIKLISFQAK